MASGSKGIFLLRRGGSTVSTSHEIRRLEDKHRSLAHAAEQWLSILHEMEHAGQSGDARYDTYYQAYLQAREQQKRVDLQLFNLRQGLSS